MPRVAFRMKLFKGAEKEYKRRHDQLWPELKTLLKKSGIKNYSIFLDGDTNDLFAYLTIGDAAKLNDLPNEAVMKKWWDYMKDIMESNADGSPASILLNEVFYLK